MGVFNGNTPIGRLVGYRGTQVYTCVIRGFVHSVRKGGGTSIPWIKGIGASTLNYLSLQWVDYLDYNIV